jgi:hypothetical protein
MDAWLKAGGRRLTSSEVRAARGWSETCDKICEIYSPYGEDNAVGGMAYRIASDLSCVLADYPEDDGTLKGEAQPACSRKDEEFLRRTRQAVEAQAHRPFTTEDLRGWFDECQAIWFRRGRNDPVARWANQLAGELQRALEDSGGW